MARYKSAAVLTLSLLAVCSSCDVGPLPQQQRAARERARAQVLRWAEKLDGKTTATGSYLRAEGEELPDADPWNTRLRVNYTNEGLGEKLTVRSAGPDRSFFTGDDITEERMTASLEGTAEVVKKNIGEVSTEAARGAVKGVIKGVKEAVGRDKPSAVGEAKKPAE